MCCPLLRYAPLLLRDPAWSSRLDPKLQTLLTDLDAALGTTVRAGAGMAMRDGCHQLYSGVMQACPTP